jgi:2,3-bisphosphoglycerate-dependent phosphoglycerate mutase
MPTLTLIRHGQSQWNLENRFTGWVDVDLTAEGEAQARKAGQLLKETGFTPDLAFSSVLTRAVRTLWLTLEHMGMVYVPQTLDWRLNERHYGALTGLNKAETAAKHGEEQLKIWRRSYDVAPPPLDAADPINPCADRRYANVAASDLPLTESLHTTLQRVIPAWESLIAPQLQVGQDVLIAAHGNSLRALVKHLFNLGDVDILGVEIPTANPLVIELDGDLRPLAARYLDATRAEQIPDIG